MAWEEREGQGTLFKNRKKQEGDNLPALTGSCKINGCECEVAVWKKQGKKGIYYSFSIKPKTDQQRPQETQARRQPAPAYEPGQDDIPF